MQEVRCEHCGNVVQVTPDVAGCPHCGREIQQLLDPDLAAQYYYARAQSMAAAGAIEQALAAANRGIGYRGDSELRLLAAILAQKLGDHDQMRQYVAAIPVDDTLRSEAEWLLRSHQERQRALREGSRQARSGTSGSLGQGALPTVLSELFGDGGSVTIGEGSAASHSRWTVVAWVAIISVVVVSALWLSQGAGALANLLGSDEPESITEPPTRLENAPADVPGDDVMVQAGTIRSSAAESVTVAPSPDRQDGEDKQRGVRESSIPTSTAQPILVPTSTPAPVAAVADRSPRPVQVIVAEVFDLRHYLDEAGLPKLAELPVEARRQGGKMMLQGTVYLDVERRQLIEVVEQIPGVEKVNAVNLFLRPLPTYVVRDGDTIWSIVYDIYGDVEQLDEFSAANADVLPVPDALSVGMVLEVPPVE